MTSFRLLACFYTLLLALGGFVSLVGCSDSANQCTTDCGGGGTGAGGSGNAWPPTTLPIDCRPAPGKLDGPNDDLPECKGPIGSGVSLGLAGLNGIFGGYYDAASDVFVVHRSGAILKVTRSAGAVSMLSGQYKDPVMGPKTAGAGPTWPSDSIIGIRRTKDGKVMVMAGDGFYTVDSATGDRALYRDYTGVPAENNIRSEGKFAIDNADNLFVALIGKAAAGGVGALRFTQTEAKVITLSGASDATRHVGMGPDDGISGYASIQYYDGKIWLLNEDRDRLINVEIDTGNRLVISSAEVGEDIDGAGHSITNNAAGWLDLVFDASKGTAYSLAGNPIVPAGHYQTKIDLATGNRSHISEYFAFYMQNPWFGQHLDLTFGKPLWLDETKGILYTTTYGVAIRGIELSTGNYNWIVYQ